MFSARWVPTWGRFRPGAVVEGGGGIGPPPPCNGVHSSPRPRVRTTPHRHSPHMCAFEPSKCVYSAPPPRDLLEWEGGGRGEPPPPSARTYPIHREQKNYCRMNNSAHGNVMLSAVNKECGAHMDVHMEHCVHSVWHAPKAPKNAFP